MITHLIRILFVLAYVRGYLSAQEKPDSLMETEIKHVVVLMLENRSFDNVLAWLYDQENPPENFIPKETDPIFKGLTEDVLEQYTNVLKDTSGKVVFSCPPIKGIPSCNDGLYLDSPKFDPFEKYSHVTNQIFGFEGSANPTMTGFLQDYASLWWDFEWPYMKDNICAVMETYTDKELPILYGLARHYAVSDLWFSSVPTQTNPNRAFMACGTSEGQTINGSLGKSIFYSDTIWNRLSEELPDTTWTIFWQADMFPILFPGPFTSTQTFPNLSKIPDFDNHLQRLDQFHEQARNGLLPDFSFIEPQWTQSVNVDPHIKLYDILGRKAQIIGLQGNDLHPPGDVRTSENFLANIYTSLIANPEAWNETLLVITFDEHGGLFDHIPPPVAIPPDNHFQDGFHFDRYGVRVPTLFISPRIKKGTVIRSDDPNMPFDHTSVISTILQWKKLDKEKWNLGKRAENAPTFDSVITLVNPRIDAPLSNDAFIGGGISIGEKFYLRNEEGDYLIRNPKSFSSYAHLGDVRERVALQFVGGQGEVTHGSFVLIQSDDPKLKNANLLEASGWGSCVYGENRHDLVQWWTIKSVSNPTVGAPIQYGDKVCFENHIYLAPFKLVPGRLVKDKSIFGKFLTLKAITEKDCDSHFWTLEKAE